MKDDASMGYDGIAEEFMAARSTSGSTLVRAWAKSLPAGSSIVDVGAGFGEPLTSVLIAERLSVYAVDASPTLVKAFRGRFPNIRITCETAEDSRFFDRSFNAALMVGLIFLLPQKRQEALIHRLSQILEPEGRLLFSAPQQICAWKDALTHRTSQSLGEEEYERLLQNTGFELLDTHMDEMGTHYYEARRI
ncbi:MAG: class I SAM-dependent methyltransferase [Pseudomonadota bacterium]